MSSEAAHVADRIERHLAANEVAPARDLLNRILPELGRDIAIFQDPGQVSFHAGFAYVCIKLDRLDRARCTIPGWGCWATPRTRPCMRC